MIVGLMYTYIQPRLGTYLGARFVTEPRLVPTMTYLGNMTLSVDR